MHWQNAALVAAGLIGASVAVFHGVLVQRLMVRPIDELARERRLRGPASRLVAPLLQFSTVVWFGGGLALAAAPLMHREARLAVCVMIGATYLFGAVGNFAATRGRHPGWMLMALALVLIALGAVAPSA